MIHVTRPQARPPAPDRQQSQVQVSKLGHLRKDVGVSGEVDPAIGVFEHETEARRIRAERRSEASMDGLGRGHADATEGRRVAGHHLDDRRGAVPSQQSATHGDDHDRIADQLPDRWQVQVVPVEVRDDHDVCAA